MATATAVKAKLKVYPLADRVAIRPTEETETMKGGLYIPDTAKEKPIQGEVIAVGPGRREKGDVVPMELKVGDRVVLQYGPNCLSTGVQPLCRSCASGNYALCERGNLPEPRPIGGGWSEEMLVHEQQLFRISPEIDDEQAVLHIECDCGLQRC